MNTTQKKSKPRKYLFIFFGVIIALIIYPMILFNLFESENNLKVQGFVMLVVTFTFPIPVALCAFIGWRLYLLKKPGT